MSIFGPQITKQNKENNEIKQHPWAQIIKDNYISQIKYAHNSIHNPKYPQLKEKQPASDRVQFTLIGDRVTKEFIYCSNVLKGLYKYKWKNFAAPVIRGVTTVDWPAVWNDLKIRYGGLVYCIESSVAVFLNDKIVGGEIELKYLLERKYIYHLCLDYYNEGVAEFVKFIRSSGRPCAYMHIAIDDEHVGTLIFQLYADLVPYTCENFLRLCKEKRGGYGGTPVHRIVKDGWIQCGGFGLKNTSLDCENFMIPHDKRGVLGMANDGRHVDCSTQFFVLLQPATWMANKYVAFGQLIEGEATLKKIESVPTWYESPKSEIIIYKCGIFNMECHDIMINKGTNEYIHGHVEDLNILGELMYNTLLEKVFLEAQLKEIERLREQDDNGAEAVQEEGEAGIRATRRFIRKKEEIDKQLSQNPTDSRHPTITNEENNDFDVEEYEYEPEEDVYKHQSLPDTASLIVKPERPYYIPLTDVPYPGEVDSNFDLKRFLKGDYCLESDLLKDVPIKKTRAGVSFPSDLLMMTDSENVSIESLDSFEEKEIQEYLRQNVDRVSFAGGIIKNIARGTGILNLTEDLVKSECLSDEVLRRFRLASVDYRSREDERKRQVSISAPSAAQDPRPNKIKRKQTGFVRPEDLEKIRIISKLSSESSDPESATDMSRKVRIAPSAQTGPSGPRPARRPTGFVRPQDINDSNANVRQSVLTRLYNEVTNDEHGPTLKEYKPIDESRPRNLLLTYSPNVRISSDDESMRERYKRHSVAVEESLEHVLNLQHGKKVSPKISSDYVKTIGQIENRLQNSIRSVEFAKTRPAISVSDYKLKNKQYQLGLKMMPTSEDQTVTKPANNSGKRQPNSGLRLPGDTPLYSSTDM